MSDIGTWQWAERTGGTMTRREQLAQARAAITARLAAIPARLRQSASGSARDLDLADPPDSTLARSAEAYVREVSTSWLYAHCVRTWLFAAALGDLDGEPYDSELLYLACLLHDLGLTTAHHGSDPAASCFAVEGARATRALIVDQGGSEHTAQAVAEAISLHLNIDVELAHGVEAHLLSRGAALDAVGRGLDKVPSTTVDSVLKQWPRDGFANALAAVIHQEAQSRPRSRASLLDRLGFTGLVLNNPMDRSATP
ncbi:HD domain-containing protein [Mycobacterium riyadhense]|uniref:HD/PDEase domain-containing protein n=1 Tax=Mycobacterium riyadhense TaxID=486698 RepID=A0A1X2BS32_9MYCO|nr:HD domain-containing protein [Mycobacterium riyadhense]MCV7148652.1 HD domain-containing protein [Mycobacterium riyadhense]ORW65989.1 hypothetical protein AWC22_02140 [Mycobacterium riyadhense]VTO98741.1 HD domain protein [Mycobacterium riyadhense]